MTRPKVILTLATLFVAAAAAASIPSGARYGAWHVVSITSLSGTAADDASATLTQENAAGNIMVDWGYGRRVVITMSFEDCYGEDEDFSEGYSVEAARWLRQPDGGAGRLHADFSTWLDQARLACRSDVRLGRFRLDGLRAAARDFSARVRALGGGR